MLSVVICTYNRAGWLAATLRSLMAMRYPPGEKTEVIVVDNNSKDATRATVEEFQPRFASATPAVLRYVFEGEQGLSHARNRGVREAAGELLFFTDDDCLIDPGWLESGAARFAAVPCIAVGGRVLAVPEAGGCPRWILRNLQALSGPIVNHDCGGESRPYRTGMPPMVGASMGFRAEAFRRHGLFDTGRGRSAKGLGLGEDTEMHRRLERAGERIDYCADSIVSHPIEPKRASLGYVGRWFREYGKTTAEPGEMRDTPLFLGAPRWLYRKAAVALASIPAGWIAGSDWPAAYRDLCICIGRFKGYRALRTRR